MYILEILFAIFEEPSFFSSQWKPRFILVGSGVSSRTRKCFIELKTILPRNFSTLWNLVISKNYWNAQHFFCVSFEGEGWGGTQNETRVSLTWKKESSLGTLFSLCSPSMVSGMFFNYFAISRRGSRIVFMVEPPFVAFLSFRGAISFFIMLRFFVVSAGSVFSLCCPCGGFGGSLIIL